MLGHGPNLKLLAWAQILTEGCCVFSSASQEFATPIVKAKKKNGKAEQSFFTLQEYENWREENEDSLSSWTIKYYKGLGTSSSAGEGVTVLHVAMREFARRIIFSLLGRLCRVAQRPRSTSPTFAFTR